MNSISPKWLIPIAWQLASIAFPKGKTHQWLFSLCLHYTSFKTSCTICALFSLVLLCKLGLVPQEVSFEDMQQLCITSL